jgi:hypothetical protein
MRWNMAYRAGTNTMPTNVAASIPQHVQMPMAFIAPAPAPLAKTVLRPVGKWNHGMIVSKGQAVEHWLNGVKVLEYTRGNEAFRRAVDVSKYKTWGTDGRRWGELPEGRLLLQDHSDSFVSYCNLKIKEL